MLRHILGTGLVLFLLSAGRLGAQAGAPPGAPAGTPPEERGGKAGASQTWSGTLADAGCKAQNPAQPCEITGSTTSFGIVTGHGMFSKFDDKGNSLVASQLQGKTGAVKARVTGKLTGDTIEVGDVRIQK